MAVMSDATVTSPAQDATLESMNALLQRIDARLTVIEDHQAKLWDKLSSVVSNQAALYGRELVTRLNQVRSWMGAPPVMTGNEQLELENSFLPEEKRQEGVTVIPPVAEVQGLGQSWQERVESQIQALAGRVEEVAHKETPDTRLYAEHRSLGQRFRDTIHALTA